VFTYDSQDAQEAKIYVDSVLVNEFSDYGGLVSDSDAPLTIGLARPGTSSFGDFEGLIDDVAIWDAALSPQQVAALFPFPAPLAYWKFDELSAAGTVAADEQGNYDGAVAGATVTTGEQGRFGEALSLDGEDDAVSAGAVAELVNPSAFSASIWFQRTVDHAGTSADTNHEVNNVLMAHSSDLANDTFEIGTKGDFIEIYLDTEQLGGSIPPIRQQAGVQTGVWHHLVMTYDSLEAEEVKIYLDGSLVSSLPDYGGLISDSVAPLSLGVARPGGANLDDFEGLIDDVAIWDAALNDQQVTALFAGTSPLIATGRGYLPQIGIDLENQLYNQNSSAYLRLPFTVDAPAAILSLDLDVKYDDAFVAYINGTEVARGNLSGTPAWNSLADTARADRSAFQAEHFVITNPAELLTAGTNVLAV